MAKKAAAMGPFGFLLKRTVTLVSGGLLMVLLGILGAAGAEAQTICNGGDLPAQGLMQPLGATQPNLIVKGKCNVVPGKQYLYGNVYIVDGGELTFSETIDLRTDFWASSIIIENNGVMKAGKLTKPFGSDGGILTILIYGMAAPSAIDSSGNKVPVADQGKGVPCQSLVPNGTKVPCGIPTTVWASNGKSEIAGCGRNLTGTNCLPNLPVAVKDRFYQYGPLYGDGGKTTAGCPAQVDGAPIAECEGYFGYKTLAVSFGGSLELYGYKGASYDTATNDNHLSSGVSWVRLAKTVNTSAASLTLSTSPGRRWWDIADTDDQIVVTTTDYLPGHSEEVKITKVSGDEVTFDPPVKWKHVGQRFSLASRLAAAAGRMTLDPDLEKDGAETRAAVALLTRSIQIVSAGDVVNKKFSDMPATYSFGAQTIVRQGFRKVQIQGVEFRQIGQGGRKWPLSDPFPQDADHAARNLRQGFVGQRIDDPLVRAARHPRRDLGAQCRLEVDRPRLLSRRRRPRPTTTSIPTSGFLPARAIDNQQNNRARCLASCPTTEPRLPPESPLRSYRSDNEYPTLFWITNGWNDFHGQHGGRGRTCGACYWFVPAENATQPDVPDTGNNTDGYMKWSGYAALQKHVFNTNLGRSVPSPFAGTTPLKSFYGNYCSSAMHSFQTTPDAPQCLGVNSADFPTAPNTLVAIKSIAPAPLQPINETDDPYYPHYIGARKATHCTQLPEQPPAYDCGSVQPCANGADEEQCGVTVLDHYTSAFNWANGNVAAIGLRPQWYLIDNSVVSDVQNAGLTIVTGGGHSRTDVIEGAGHYPGIPSLSATPRPIIRMPPTPAHSIRAAR